MNRIFKIRSCILLLVLLIAESGFGEIRLPKLISNGLVLQRDADLSIWGWADQGEKIRLEFLGKTYQTVADDHGNWKVRLHKLTAGGPYSMNIVGNNSIVLNDILIGDVWVCSGQSNIDLTMNRASPIYGPEIAQSENTFIRYFEVPRTYNFSSPKDDLASGKWQPTNPTTVLNFSAVAYFFASELYNKYKIPIGVITASLGGSPAEAWLSEEAIQAFPTQYAEFLSFKDGSLTKKIEEEDHLRSHKWYSELSKIDEGYQGKSWKSTDLDDSQWKMMNVPGYWADGELGHINGVVWFRKEIQVPESMTGKPVKLELGRIVDADSVFVNGTFVGTTSYQYPPRRYEIPTGVLKAGKNTLVVRVISNSGNGGFVSDKTYSLYAGDQTLDLKGQWKYRLGAKMEPLQGETAVRMKPVGLYNAMIAPLLNFSIKGAVWYQGESNAERPVEYAHLLPALIQDWRSKWNVGNFPFLIVQLPNFMAAKDQPSESNWACLREAQLKTLSLPNTGMAVAIDLGEWNDIHPLNKKDVGKRLSLSAQKVAYGEKKVVGSGPIYQSMKIKGNKIELSFSDTGSGLVAKGNGELKQFAVAGADKKYVWAKAKIKGNKVIVWNETISKPVAVRYAWADNPAGANLFNQEGLPASPFRTTK